MAKRIGRQYGQIFFGLAHMLQCEEEKDRESSFQDGHWSQIHGSPTDLQRMVELVAVGEDKVDKTPVALAVRSHYARKLLHPDEEG